MADNRIILENEILKSDKGHSIIRYLFIYFIAGLMVLQPQLSFTQTRHLDSLRKSVAFAKNNEQKLAAVFSLCDEANSLNPDTLAHYCNMADMLAVKEKDTESIIQSRFYTAMYLSRKGRLDTAIAIVDSCIITLKQKDNTKLQNRFMMLKSNLLIRSDKQKESMNNSLQLLRSAEATNDVYVQMRAKILIGWAYMELSQNRKALDWLFAAEKLQNTLPQNLWQPFLHSDMAALYNELKKNDSALYYIKKSLEEALQKNDLSYLANTYFIYGGISADMGQKNKAVNLLEKGLRFRELIGDPFYIVSDIYQMGLFYADNKQPSKGIAILHEGIAMAYQNRLFEKLPILYSALARNYQIAGNYKEYAQTLDTLIQLKDSLYKKNSADALAEMQAKYEVQKKENTIIHQQYDIAKKDLFIYTIGGLLCITLLIGFFIFQNRKKNQRLKLQAIEMEQKRELTHAVMKAEEEERKRIAADLHDSVAQKMVVAKLNLEALAINLDMVDQKKTIFENISLLLKESTEEVRSLSHSMMPHAFERYGLTNSIKDFLNKIHKKDLKINFNAEGDFKQLKDNKAFLIYRIMQECIQNALKHSAATKLDISMMCANNEADIIIEDNGKGFNINENNSGNGLKNIQSRVEFLNGKLEINSVPEKGTVIAIFVPL